MDNDLESARYRLLHRYHNDLLAAILDCWSTNKNDPAEVKQVLDELAGLFGLLQEVIESALRIVASSRADTGSGDRGTNDLAYLQDVLEKMAKRAETLRLEASFGAAGGIQSFQEFMVRIRGKF
jgi:hypothetical protein